MGGARLQAMNGNYSIYPNLFCVECSIFLLPLKSPGVMFKKLKQKIEEGSESGIDKVAFSPRKFPGSVVRSSSQTEEAQAAPPAPQTSENVQPPATTAVQEPLSESRDEDQGITVESVTAPFVIRGSEQVGDWFL